MPQGHFRLFQPDSQLPDIGIQLHGVGMIDYHGGIVVPFFRSDVHPCADIDFSVWKRGFNLYECRTLSVQFLLPVVDVAVTNLFHFLERRYKKYGSNTEITSFDELGKFTSVKAIASEAFKNCVNLKSIDLVNIETIGQSAFHGSGLSINLYLPKLIGIAGYNTFNGTNITGITDLGRITGLASGIFANCLSLINVKLPNTLVGIGSICFDNNSSLKTINLESVERMDWGVFRNCTSLSIEVNMPKLTSIAQDCFMNTGITRVVSLGNITTIPMRSFNGCTSLASVDIFSTVESIGSNAFYNCKSLSGDLELPLLSTLGNSSFYAAGIRKVVNLGSITELPYYTFLDCKNLEYIELPSTITKIGDWAVGRCYKLTVCILHSNEPPQIVSTTFSGSLSCIFYVPDAAVSNYKAATNWSEYASRIKGISELPE